MKIKIAEPFEPGCVVECRSSKHLFPLLKIFNEYQVYGTAFYGAALYISGISDKGLGPFSSERFVVTIPADNLVFDRWDWENGSGEQ